MLRAFKLRSGLRASHRGPRVPGLASGAFGFFWGGLLGFRV